MDSVFAAVPAFHWAATWNGKRKRHGRLRDLVGYVAKYLGLAQTLDFKALNQFEFETFWLEPRPMHQDHILK